MFCLQILNQLRSGCFVPNQDAVNPKESSQFLHFASEVGVVQPLPKNVEEINVSVGSAPGRADTVVAEFG